MKFKDMDSDYESPVGLLTVGILTDGGHHKQWALDQALQKILGPIPYKEYVKAIERMGYEWDKGIAP